MTGETNGKLKTADLLTFQILTKEIVMSEDISRTGLRELSTSTVLMELESILSQKFQKTFGLSMDKPPVSSRWESASTVTQLTLVHIKELSLVSSTTQCTTLSRMSLALENQ